MPIKLDSKSLHIIEQALPIMAEFRSIFGRELTPDFIAELCVARELGLEIFDSQNAPGSDAIGSDGKLYQIKYRNAQNVDVNNFSFDFLILANFDHAYNLIGMWRLTREQAEKIFTLREKYNKYQATQDKIKANSERIK